MTTSSGVRPKSRAELAKEIGALEGDLSELEEAIRKRDIEASKAGRNRTLGASVLLTGIATLFILNSYPYVWATLIILGALTLAIAIYNHRAANKERDVFQGEVTATRSKLAELRALISAP